MATSITLPASVARVRANPHLGARSDAKDASVAVAVSHLSGSHWVGSLHLFSLDSATCALSELAFSDFPAGVSTCCFLDASRVVAGLDDGSVVVAPSASPDNYALIAAHGSSIVGLSCGLSAGIIVSLAVDGSIACTDTSSQRLLWAIPPQQLFASQASCLAVSRTLNMVFAAGSDRRVIGLDGDTGKVKFTVKIAEKPTAMLALSNSVLLVGDETGFVHVFDCTKETPSPIQSTRIHKSAITDFSRASSSSSSTNSSLVYAGSHDGTVVSFVLTDKNRIEPSSQHVAHHKDLITSIDIFGSTLLVGGYDAKLTASSLSTPNAAS
jgi:WD40 repeat protein